MSEKNKLNCLPIEEEKIEFDIVDTQLMVDLSSLK